MVPNGVHGGLGKKKLRHNERRSAWLGRRCHWGLMEARWVWFLYCDALNLNNKVEGGGDEKRVPHRRRHCDERKRVT